MSSDPKDPGGPDKPTPSKAEGGEMNRRQFVIRLTAYGAAAVATSAGLATVARAQGTPGTEEDDPPVSAGFEGTAEIESEHGATSYAIKGGMAYQTFIDRSVPAGSTGLRFLSLSFEGHRVSGPDLGPITLNHVEPLTGLVRDRQFRTEGKVVYTDHVHGRLDATGNLSGIIDVDTDVIDRAQLHAIAVDAEGRTVMQGISVGVAIPIGKNAE